MLDIVKSTKNCRMKMEVYKMAVLKIRGGGRMGKEGTIEPKTQIDHERHFGEEGNWNLSD